MSRFDPYLKTYADANNGSGVRMDIAEVSQSIRGRNLYSGQPRNPHGEEAIARAVAALKLASQTNEKLLVAEACRLMGHTLNANEQYADSIDYYQKAVALFEAAGAGEQAARTCLGFMAALYMMGNYQESLSIAATAERWFQANNHRMGLAKVYANLGNLHYRQERHAIGLQYHSKSRELFEQLQDWHALAITRLNLANGLSSTDRLKEAEDMYNACEELSARLGMQELRMQARYNRSYLMFLQGHSSKALESLADIRKYFVQTESEHHVNLCDLDASEIYLHRLQPAEAVAASRPAISGFSKTILRYEHAKALAFCAMGLSQIDSLEEAENAAATSRDMFEQEGNRYWISMMEFCLASLRLARGDVSKARLLATQARIQFEGLELKSGLADSLSRLGSLAMESSQIKTTAACMTELLKLTINKRR